MSSSATDRDDRSSAEIERDVEQTRSGLSHTLEELRDRAAPGQLFEQALDYARTSGGADMMRNLGQAVRDNPLPLVLIGAGIGWLMFTGNQRTHQHSRVSARHLPGPSYGTPTTGTPTTGTGAPYGGHDGTGHRTDGPSVTERASGLVGRAGATAGQMRDTAAGTVGQAADKAGAALHDARDAAGAATERLAASAHGVQHYAHDVTDSARQGLGWLMREQPLVLGAIGLALGAAVGALLPGTEAEDRMMGETRDAMAERAKATAQEGYGRVKETAGEHLEHAKAAAGDATNKAGGTAAGLGHAVTEAAQQVRHAARDAAHDLAGEARNTMGAGEGQERGQNDRPDQARPDQARPDQARPDPTRTDEARRADAPIVGPPPVPPRSGPL
jgi:ElaB/YqjD/DUF883 family membrane-anchored ribosome-binding protein